MAAAGEAGTGGTCVRRALVITGKAPEPGRTKTRLSPPLTPLQAAHLYRGFLQDTVRMALGLGWERTSLIYPPRVGAREELAALLPSAVTLVAQAGAGLGEALGGAIRDHLADALQRVVIIGSDNPTLPPEIVAEAARGLDDHDLVVGPSHDGGYYLIGMDRAQPGLFEGIAWSTSVVYRQTLERARAADLSVLSLPEWYDVDTAADLEVLRADLARLPPDVAPTTRALLAAMRW